MPVRMYVCTYVIVSVFMDAWLYACMYVCMHACIYAFMYVCMHVCMYMVELTALLLIAVLGTGTSVLHVKRQVGGWTGTVRHGTVWYCVIRCGKV